MDGKDFIEVAAELANGRTEAHWRSAISRAYYAAFHVAKEALAKQKVWIPRSHLGHEAVRNWMLNNKNEDISSAGSSLANLLTIRGYADYDVATRSVNQNDAMLQLANARAVITSVEKFL